MKQPRLLLFSSTLVIWFSHLALSASQTAPQNCAVWGQVMGTGNLSQRSNEHLSIELAGNGTKRQHVPLVNGNFDFRSVPAGVYEFRVKDQHGHVLLERTRRLKGDDRVLLLLPFSNKPRPPAATVSLRELGNRVLGRARDAFRFSEKALESGQIEKSLKYMESAVAIDPQFAEAQLNLGTKYVQEGRDQEALEHLQSAFDLDTQSPEAAYDLAMLLILTKDYPRAEAVARRFLQTGESSAAVNAALALSLIRQNRNLDEAYAYLRKAAWDFPIARLMTANALAATGRIAPAVVQAREYLDTSAHPCEREELHAWLSRIGEGKPLAGIDRD